MKKLILILLMLSLITSLSSCIFSPFIPWDPTSYTYDGDNKPLYSAANYSILGMKTDALDKVLVLEHDGYGRTMYLVRTNSWICQDKFIVALLISQACTEQSVSYYHGRNVTYVYADYFELTTDSLSAFFDDSQIDDLKSENDWGKPIQADKCIERAINVSDYDAEFVSQDMLDRVADEIFPDEGLICFDPIAQLTVPQPDGCFSAYLCVDISENSSGVCYLVVFHPESDAGELNFLYQELEDESDYQEQLDEMIEKFIS